MKPSQQQTEFTFRAWGGKRKNAGRKPMGNKPKVPHAARPLLASRHPVHVTLKVARRIPNLRRSAMFAVIRRSLELGKERFAFRVVQFSVQVTHIHLLCEAKDKRALSRGLKGLAVRFAKSINKLLGTRGQVFPERYHARILRTPTEVRRTLRYLLLNRRRHKAQRGWLKGERYLDPCSSAPYFSDWADLTARPPPARPPPVAEPHTWLLDRGWLKAGGPISPTEVPG